MWSAVGLSLGGISFSPVAPTPSPSRHLVGVGRNERVIGEGDDQRQLSGSDVLMALHRASATKSKEATSNGDKRYKDAGAAISIRARARGISHSSRNTTIYPICINPQWAHRLHQLETNLHQLLHDDIPSSD